MEKEAFFRKDEKSQVFDAIKRLRSKNAYALSKEDERKVYGILKDAIQTGKISRDMFDLNPILLSLQTAEIAIDEIGLKRDGTIAIILHSCLNTTEAIENIENIFGGSVGTILKGLVHIQELYKKNPVVESENFRNLLLSFAQDMRVILIMIADRVNLMRQIRDTDHIEEKRK